MAIRKRNRLKSKQIIEDLFQSGQRLKEYPFRLLALKIAGQEASKLSVSVPKRLINKAVDRNKVKRRIMESWREEMKVRSVDSNWMDQFSFMIILMSREQPSIDDCRIKINLLLNRLQDTAQSPTNHE